MSEEMSNESPIIARAGRYYRNTRILMVVILIGYGAWSLYDGYVKYPRDNEAAARKKLEKLPHPDLDVPFNQWLGIFLPPLGIAFLIWTLYNSRGEYRFANGTLHVPGHPAVPVSGILKIDKTRWDRKGIAYIGYQTPAANGTLKLDDFVYDRGPTDKILEQIERAIQPEAAPLARSAAAGPPPRPPRQQVR